MATVQKICVYENDQKFYIVGSNCTETAFRILELDRSHPTKLIISDDGVEYQKSEIQGKIGQFQPDSRTREKQKKQFWLVPCMSAYGIVGFVKFLEGYYMILVTKRKRVAIIGGHTIYKIEDTSMIYIPQVGYKTQSNEESRYLKIFQNIDLSSNFYFCYSYDLTHSLQYNLTGCNTKDIPKEKFVWNKFHWKEAKRLVSPAWNMSIIHGFVGQVNVSIYGRSVYVGLIARRSSQYAGTRYLKRGSNAVGDVANEVETEQIVYDASLTSFQRGRYTSYLQCRGSVPGLWSQDISSMVPKPPITVNVSDPYFNLSAAHFNQLLRIYGSPVIVINLVKKHEKRKRESKLTDELLGAVQYLNQFLPPEHCIRYRHIDMAKYKKCPKLDVIAKLESVAESVVEATGLFMYGPLLDPGRQNTKRDFSREGKTIYKQTGVVRTNCVDCLDRTNTSQFMVGKQALGHQLFALGFVSKTDLKFDTDCVRMLSEIYEEMGDTLAVQYGGSQLVHSVDSYRKLSPWMAQSRDIKQTVSRYYRNAFSDADKQDAINLFLGIFRPETDEKLHMWDDETDHYLHHSVNQSKTEFDFQKSPSHWFEDEVIESLPLPYEETRLDPTTALLPVDDAEYIFKEHYHPEEFTSLADLFCVSDVPHSTRLYMAKDISPFTVRTNQPQRKEESRQHGIFNLSFSKDSAKAIPDCSTSDADSSSSDDSVAVLSPNETTEKDVKALMTMKDIFPTMQQMYGVQLTEPSKQDATLYRRFVAMATTAISEMKRVKSKSGATILHSPMTSPTLMPLGKLPSDSIFEVAPPVVNDGCRAEYEAFIERGTLYGANCTGENYQKYIGYLRRH